MKKLFPTSMALAILMMLANSLGTQAQIVTKTLSFKQNLVSLRTDTIEKQPFTILDYDGMYTIGAPGAPALPAQHYRFAIPSEAKTVTVKTAFGSPTLISLIDPIIPNQESRTLNEDPIFTQPDKAAYEENIYGPEKNTSIAMDGFIFGENHVLDLMVSPFSYNPKTGILRFFPDMTLTMTFDAGLDERESCNTGNDEEPVITPEVSSKKLKTNVIYARNKEMRERNDSLLFTIVENPENESGGWWKIDN